MPVRASRQSDDDVQTTPDSGDQDNRQDRTGPDVDSEAIARRAYERFEARGGEHGHDQDDWFEAERELRGSSE